MYNYSEILTCHRLPTLGNPQTLLNRVSDILSPVVPQTNAPLTPLATNDRACFSIVSSLILPSACMAVGVAAIRPVKCCTVLPIQGSSLIIMVKTGIGVDL